MSAKIRSVIDYLLLDGSGPEDLTSQVLKFILEDDHYEPYGAPFSATYDDGSVGFYQAVVKYGDVIE